MGPPTDSIGFRSGATLKERERLPMLDDSSSNSAFLEPVCVAYVFV